MTGQHVRQSKDLSGQYPILTGHCPLTGRYLQPCYFIKIDTEIIASSLQSIAAFCNGGDCWQPLKLFSYLLFSTVYLTFASPSAEGKKHFG